MATTFKTLRERLEIQIEGMVADRRPFEQDWEEIGRLALPNRVDLSSNATRSRRANTTSHDTAGRIAGRRLTNGMATGLSSSARPWFKLTTRDPELRDWQPVKEWLDQVEQAIYGLFAKTNYYDATKMQYADIGHMGVGVVMGVEDPEYLAVWHHLPVGSYWISLDHGLRVNRLVRKIAPSVENVVRMARGDWGKLSSVVKTAYDKGDLHVRVPCMHVIQRNMDARGQFIIPSIRRPWASIKWEVGNSNKNALIQESGYDSQPFSAPRWETLGDQVYCETAPGFDALPDLRELQLVARRGSRAMDNLVKPALAAQAGLVRQGLSLDPGTINWLDSVTEGVVRPILQTDPRTLEIIGSKQDALARRVNELFYADLFMAISEMEGVQPRNEQELMFRNEEKLTQLGPVVDRVNIEKLEVDVDRAYTLLKNLGMLPPIPDELQGEPLSIDFISILAQAQRASENIAIERAARFVGFVAGMFPDAAIKFDAEQAIDEFAAASGTSPRIIRSDEMVAKMKADMAAQQQQQQMAEMAPAVREGAQAAELLSRTQIDPEGGSALQALLGR